MLVQAVLARRCIYFSKWLTQCLTLESAVFQPAANLDNSKPSSCKESKDFLSVQQNGMTMRLRVEYRLFWTHKENKHQLKFTKIVIVHSPPRII